MNVNKYKKQLQIVQGSRDGSAKKNGNKGRLVATNAMEHPCYIDLATEMK